MVSRALIVAALFSLPAQAQLPRLLPLFDLDAERPSAAASFELSDFVASGGDAGAAKSPVEEPLVFWTADGLLCAQLQGGAQTVECHQLHEAGLSKRALPKKTKRPVRAIAIGGATLASDGAITNGDVKYVRKLRCARSSFSDLGEYRYVPGPNGQLAVLVLEQDDRRVVCARLDAQCGPPSGPWYWRVLVSTPDCPSAE